MKAAGTALLLAAGLLALAAGVPLHAADGSVAVRVEPRQGTVGDQLQATIELDLVADAVPRLREVGPRLGPFSVISGSWSGPVPSDTGQRWTWEGRISAYRTGSLELPAVTLEYELGGETREVSSQKVAVELRSVLEEQAAQGAELEIADLKPPAAVPAEYRTLWIGLGLLGLLLAGALLLWWLQRRYAARLAAARVPEDPFHRMAPHEWVYRELQRLLERRLEEQGFIDLFYAELSRIVKFYLGGRYRVDLMERTTEEAPPVLRQAGAPEKSILAAREFLGRCDLVKFAGQRPGPERSREIVEAAYRLVDMTRPAGAEADGAHEGAA